MRIIEFMSMKAKQDASLGKEQFGIVEIPFRMFDMVTWGERMLNRIIVGDCCGECFWCGIEEGRVKNGGRHIGMDERLKMEMLLFLQFLSLLNRLFLSATLRYFISVIGCR